MGLSKKLIPVLITCLAVKFLLGAFVPLGVDESYYLLYARFFEWHYYDHPFLTGTILKLVTGIFDIHHPLFYRFPFIAASIVATVFVFRTGILLGGKTAGWLAVLLYSASPYMFIIAGLFVMPDPFMVTFWTGAIYFSARFFFDDNLSFQKKSLFMVWFAIFVGLAMASKIHAVLLWIGFGGYCLFFQRSVFRNFLIWVCLLISLIAWIPMFVWNMKNDWVHFSFYNSRVGTSGGIRLDYLVREIIGELFYQNPVVWLLIIFFLWTIWKKKSIDPQKIFLLFFSLPLIGLIWAVSLFRETLPHWSGPAYISLILLTAIEIKNRATIKPGYAKIPFYAMSLSGLLMLAAVIMIHFYPGTFGKKENSRNYGQHDFTLDMFGWGKSGLEMAKAIKAAGLQNTPIYVDNWFPGAQVEENIARVSGNTVFGVGDLKRIHQYQWLNKRRGGLPETDSALFISVSNYPADPHKIYGNQFTQINCIDSVPEKRMGRTTRFYHLYLMTR